MDGGLETITSSRLLSLVYAQALAILGRDAEGHILSLSLPCLSELTWVPGGPALRCLESLGLCDLKQQVSTS